MKSLALRSMNKLGNAMTQRQRRFVLNRLGVAILLDNLAGDQFDELPLPNGISLSFSPLLHAHISKNGQLEYEDQPFRCHLDFLIELEKVGVKSEMGEMIEEAPYFEAIEAMKKDGTLSIPA